MNPTPIGQIFAAWMAATDVCTCGNLQTPNMVLPINYATDTFRAHYRCDDCGNTWTTAYPTTRKEAA